MYRVKIFSDYGLDNLGHLHTFFPTNKIQVVQEDYTHVIIINTVMPELPAHIPKERVLGLAYEPRVFLQLTPAFITYAQTYIGQYYIGNQDDLPEPFIASYSFLTYCVPPPMRSHIKPKFMSIIFSSKQQTPNHIYRHKLVEAILHTPYLPIDIYGRGCKKFAYSTKKLDTRLKGDFQHDQFPYLMYDYHIAIENTLSTDYVSEKLVNPLLYDCKTLYYGASNAIKYFPSSRIKYLTGNLTKDLQTLKDLYGVFLKNDAAVKTVDNERYAQRQLDVRLQASLSHNLPAIFEKQLP